MLLSVYCLMAAVISGISVAGIVIAIELTNDCRMVSCVVPDCSTST